MSSILIAILGLLTQATPTPPPSPQKPAPAPVWTTPVAPVRFTTGMSPGDARLLEIQGSTNGEVSIAVGKNKVDLKKRTTTSYRIVDSMVEPGENAWSGWRRFVKAQATDDGEISDPELTGLEADVACSKDAVVNFKIRGGRGVTNSRLARLLAEAGGFGLHLGLPAELAPGQECEVDFSSLAQWCFDLSGTATSAKARVKLSGVDAKKNVVRLAGNVTVEEKIDESAADSSDGVATKASGRYEGDVEIDYDLSAKRVVRLACKGKGHLEGDLFMIPPAKVAADTTHQVTILSAAGAAVAAAMKEKPQTRDVPHKVEAAGIVLMLPSHFFRAHVEGDDAIRFGSQIDGEERAFNVRVTGFEEAGQTLQAETDAFGKSLAEHNPGLKITESPVASGVGAGRAYEWVTGGIHSLACLIDASGGRFATIQFIAAEPAWAAHAKECPKILQSLKKLPAKK